MSTLSRAIKLRNQLLNINKNQYEYRFLLIINGLLLILLIAINADFHCLISTTCTHHTTETTFTTRGTRAYYHMTRHNPLFQRCKNRREIFISLSYMAQVSLV